MKLSCVLHMRDQYIICCCLPYILLDHLIVHLSNRKWQQVHQINVTIIKKFNFWIERLPVNAPVPESLMNSCGFFFKYLPWWIHLIIFWLVRRPPIMLKISVDAIFPHCPPTFLFLLVTSMASSTPYPFSYNLSTSYFMSVLALYSVYCIPKSSYASI